MEIICRCEKNANFGMATLWRGAVVPASTPLAEDLGSNPARVERKKENRSKVVV
jgi:hypothetical protein